MRVLVVLSALAPLFIVLWIVSHKLEDAERENAILRAKIEKCACQAESGR